VTGVIARILHVDLADPPPAVVDGLRALPPADQAGTRPVQLARAAARLALASVLGIDPGAVVISRRCEHCGDPVHGRPVVASVPPVSFSLSHSHSVAVIAVVAGNVRVGVDIEAVRPRAKLTALARRVLSPREHADWQAAPPADQLERFLRAWTRKEAYLKATGLGIATDLRTVEPGGPGWTVVDLDAPPGAVAALAVEAPAVTVAAAQWE
jgi:4'-phosphopantetheinyl transferase